MSRRRIPSKLRISAPWLSAVALCLSATDLLAAASQPDAPVLELLSDPDFRVRQHATDELLSDRSVTLETIKNLFAQADLPEQRHRLSEIARHHVIRDIRKEQFPDQGIGAVGIAHRAFVAKQLPDVGRPGIAVLQTYPGFPAHGSLHPGDIIIAVDGQPFEPKLTSHQLGQQFISSIREHQAGDPVKMLVARHGHTQVILVQLQLASLDALTQMYDAENRRLNDPFNTQWQTVENELNGTVPDAQSLLTSDLNASTQEGSPDKIPPASSTPEAKAILIGD